MKRSFSLSTALVLGAINLSAAAPAFAQYEDDYDAIFGTGVCAIYACIGVFAILSLVFWVWMIIDLIGRQEHEFPNSTGNSKTVWILVMVGSWLLSAPLLAAIAYYFMVYRKIRRGTPPPAGPVGYQPPVAPPQAPPAPPAPPVPPAPPAAPEPPVPPAPPAPPEG